MVLENIQSFILRFLSIQMLKKLSQLYHLTYSLSGIFFITFSTLNSFWFVFLQLFFVKCSKNYFSFKISNNICPQDSVFNFFSHKYFFGLISNTAFLQKCFSILIFQQYHHFKFRIFISNLFTKVNKCAWFYINRVHSIVLWHVLFYLLTISSNSSIYTFFNTEVTYLLILFFKVLTNLSATADYFSLRLEYISVSFFSLYMVSLIYYKVHFLYFPIFCLVCD